MEVIRKRDPVGFVSLNRPEAMNTFNVPLAIQLNRALMEFDEDPEVRVVVIKAQGK